MMHNTSFTYCAWLYKLPMKKGVSLHDGMDMVWDEGASANEAINIHSDK